MVSGTRRSIALLVAGAFIGALLVAPAGAHVGGTVQHLWTEHIRPLAKQIFYTKAQSDGRYVRAAQTNLGFANCPANAFTEQASNDSWNSSAGYRYLTDLITSGAFECNAALPNGAQVTAVRFSVRDSQATEGILCDMFRTRILPGRFGTGSIGFVDTMASVSSVGSPSNTVLSDTTIAFPTVSRDFAYRLRCILTGTGVTLGFYGASVQYEITGAQGAAS
jgi:hypothetical protein